jgi:hypothetical protein
LYRHFAVIPWFSSGGVIDHQLSVFLQRQDHRNLKARAENRCNSIDLLLNECFAQLFSLAHTQNLEALPMKIRPQSCM